MSIQRWAAAASRHHADAGPKRPLSNNLYLTLLPNPDCREHRRLLRSWDLDGSRVLGLLWPRTVSRVIGIHIPGRLGLSEVRATYGGLFIGAGLAVTLIGNRDAALVLGAAWAGAFLARTVSFVIDRSHMNENIAGLAIEATIALLLLSA